MNQVCVVSALVRFHIWKGSMSNYSPSVAPDWNWELAILFIPITLASALAIHLFLGSLQLVAKLCFLLPAPTPACTEQTAADRPRLWKHPFWHVTSFLCLTCLKSFSNSPFPVKFLHHLARFKQVSGLILPILPSLHLSPTCHSALSSRGGLHSVPIHWQCIPYL